MKILIRYSSIISLLTGFIILLHSCKKQVVTIVTTAVITDITATSAISGGNIIDDGGAEVTARGICWSTNENPTISDSKTNDSSGPGQFVGILSGLEGGTLYHVRAYATNTFGTAYGDQITFEPLPDYIGTGQPCPGLPTIIDSRDGRTYHTVQIGNQCWLKENLRYLPEVFPSSNGSEINLRYYVNGYEGISVNDAKSTVNYGKYGVLYNYPAAKKGCPVGWHLPNDSDWETLGNFVISQNSGYVRDGQYWYEVGEHLKTRSGWPNGNGLDSYGFSGLPGGSYY